MWYEDRSLLNYATFGLLGRSKSSIEEIILVGNNKEEVILKFKQNRIEAYIQNAIKNYELILHIFFNPLIEISNEIKRDIKSLEQSLVMYKNNLKN